jgi:hypothetical protein
LRDVAPAIDKLHVSILTCIADAAMHAATRAEHAAEMEEVAAARWASVMEREDLQLNLVKANVAAKKRKEDLKILLVDTSSMDGDVKARCVEECTMILSERWASPATQPSAATPTATVNMNICFDPTRDRDSTGHRGFTIDSYTPIADHCHARFSSG